MAGANSGNFNKFGCCDSHAAIQWSCSYTFQAREGFLVFGNFLQAPLHQYISDLSLTSHIGEIEAVCITGTVVEN